MKQKITNIYNTFTTAVVSFSYRFIEKYEPLKGLIRKGGIRFKWALAVSIILFIMVIMFISLFTIMSSNALVSANDILCHTIAGNISSTESILTAEQRPMKHRLFYRTW